MFVSRHPADGFHKCRPRLLLLRQQAPPFSRQPVEAATALVELLDPRAFDPSTLLESVKPMSLIDENP